MNVRTHLVVLGLGFLVASAGASGESLASPRPGRTVAITIDDLPGNRAGMVEATPAALAAMTRKLHAALAAHGAPAVGFVNAEKLDVEGEDDAARAARVEVLRSWIVAGLELGNHTYSHPSLNRTELAEFEADVERGEPVLRELLAERGQRLRWFRHPYLQVGLELPKRRAFEAWLAARGYTVAPVTVDNDEWIFAAVYADALRRGDGERAARVAEAYLDYMERVFAFVEEVSGQLLGRGWPAAGCLTQTVFPRKIRLGRSDRQAAGMRPKPVAAAARFSRDVCRRRPWTGSKAGTDVKPCRPGGIPVSLCQPYVSHSACGYWRR